MKSNVFNLLAVVFIVLALFGAPAIRLTQAQELGTLSGNVMQGTALGAAFTYQGRLTNASGAPANGEYDFEFKLYDALSGASQVGGTVVQNNVTVTDGLFTVQLDFGNVFDGTALYLEIGVRPAGGGTYATLTPRLALTAAPYALYASKAPWSGLTGVPAGFADGMDDDTTYIAGDGLALSGDQFSITTTYRLPQACGDGQIAEWNATTSAWICASAATGDITGVTAGEGLTGGGASGDVTLNADTTYLQLRVSGVCVADSSISVVNADGTVSCEADDNTTYTAGDGLELVGTQFKGRGTSYQNVVIVARSGGDFTNIQAALDSIGDASASNPYLIYVAPGTYTEIVTMKPYVDIEGAGELTTKITSSGSINYDTGTVLGADDAELRFLTVENTGGADYAIAIYNNNASLRLTHVTASASGGTESFGVYNFDSSSPMMTDVTSSASGGTFGNYGVYNFDSSSPMMTDVTAGASEGMYSYGVRNDSSSPTMTNITASAWGGTNNYGVQNSFSSPTMTNVIASAWGGTSNYGVRNDDSSPTMTNVTTSAWGGTSNYGVRNDDSSPMMTNVTVSASGGMNIMGVYNNSSSPTINNSLISSSGGTSNGIYNDSASSGTYTVLVNNSQINGSADAIYNGTGFTTRVGASQLSGGIFLAGGTVTCAGVYDENYAFYASTCP